MSGTVSIDDDGNVSGSGDALELYNSIFAQETAASPLSDPDVPDADWDGTPAAWRDLIKPLNVKIKRAWARQAQAHADVLSGAGLALAGNATTTSASATDTNLAFPVKSGEIWCVEFDGMLSCSGIGGVKLGVNAPPGSTVNGYADGAGANSATWVSVAVNNLATPVGAFTAAAGGFRMARMRVTVTAGADGDVTFQFASVTAGQTSTVQAGASLRARKLASA